MNNLHSDSSVWAQGRLGKSGKEPEIVFAQMREDAVIELDVLRSRPRGETAFCIGSGGCTAFALLLAEPAQVQIVDVNPAQVYLVELKKAALGQLSYNAMMNCILADATPYYEALSSHISLEAQQFWQARKHLLSEGLTNCGIIEHRLAQIMKLLPLVQSRRHQRRLFRAKTLQDQQHIYKAYWNHWRWKLAFELILSKPVLKLAYGKEFLQILPDDFAQIVKNRVDKAFLDYPLQENGYLWQMFRGVYPRQQVGLPLYLQTAHYQTIQQNLNKAVLACADAAQWLEAQPAGSIGFFALSNILDVTAPGYAERLLRAVKHAAKPGAKACLRSLMPIDDKRLGQALPSHKFEVLPSDNLKGRDRSVLSEGLRVLRVNSD